MKLFYYDDPIIHPIMSFYKNMNDSVKKCNKSESISFNIGIGSLMDPIN